MRARASAYGAHMYCPLLNCTYYTTVYLCFTRQRRFAIEERRPQKKAASGRWQTNAKGFIAACEALYGECPVATGYALTKELDRLAPLLKERDGVTIRRASHGSGGRDYCFAGRPAKPALSA